MGPSRKRSSSKSSGGVSSAPKKEKSHNSSVTPQLAIPTEGWTNDDNLYNVQCKLESNKSEDSERNGELEEPNLDSSIRNEYSKLEDIVPVKAITISREQSTGPVNLHKVKDEREETDISNNPNEDLIRQSVSLLCQTNTNEPLQDEKWMQDGNGKVLNFTAEAGNKKKKSYTCFCGKNYSCNSHLNRHRKSHGSEHQLVGGHHSLGAIKEKTKEQSFTCHCGKHYATKANLKRHQKNCSTETKNEAIDPPVTFCNVEDQEEKIKPYVCACGKRYTCSSHLYRHQRSHLEAKTQSEKSYVCECGKAYSCSSHLYRHQKTHTEEKVLLGEQKENSAEDPENVERSMKPYVCFCGKSYTCSSHLYRHQRTHQGVTVATKEKCVVEDNEEEKRYQCNCGRSYTSSSHLYRHQRKHKDQDCFAEHNDSDHYNDGESEYSRQKPYRCECGKSFILSFSLLLHKKIHCRWKHSSSD